MPEEVALVGIVPRKGLWSLIERERWYHIPVESAPGNALSVRFGGREINQELPACLREVAQTITTLGGAAG